MKETKKSNRKVVQKKNVKDEVQTAKITPVQGTLKDVPVVKTDSHYRMSRQDKIFLSRVKNALRPATKRAIMSADCGVFKRAKEARAKNSD